MKFVRVSFFTAVMVSVPAIAADMSAKVQTIANNAVHSTQLDASARSMRTTVEETHYDLLIRYAATVEPEADERAVLQSFVSGLVAAGLSPARQKSINVCAEQTGLTTPTGAQGVRLLGCTHYNPFTEAVRFDPP
jgi:hypothetical protein